MGGMAFYERSAVTVREDGTFLVRLFVHLGHICT